MVYIREEGWKELKVGCTFDIEVFPTWDKETQEWEELAHAVNNRYVAHLGGPEVLGEKLWADAKQRGWEGAKDKQAIGDGAPWMTKSSTAIHPSTERTCRQPLHAQPSQGASVLSLCRRRCQYEIQG
jgi:hypothetical protein